MTLIQGAHILQQVASISNARGYEDEIRAAVDKAPFTTLCFRVGWRYDFRAIHEYGAELAHELNLQYAPRMMAGRYTPAAVLEAGPHYTWTGKNMAGGTEGPYVLPLPCHPDGTPNTAFIDAACNAAIEQNDWADEINHLFAPGRLWAELDFGNAAPPTSSGDVLRQPGNTLDNVVVMHVKLYEAFRAVVSGILELPLSGHGNCERYINAVTDRAVILGDVRTIFQMNGWQELGVMWTPNTGGGVVQPPPAWCRKPVGRAFQAFDVLATHDWGMMFDRVTEARDANLEPKLATYAECYLDRSIMQAPSDMLGEIVAYTATEPPDPGTCEDRLNDMTAQRDAAVIRSNELESQLDATRFMLDKEKEKVDQALQTSRATTTILEG